MKKDIIIPILEQKIKKIIAGKISLKDTEYQEILRLLWHEYQMVCRDNTKMTKESQQIIDKMNRW